MNLQNLISVLNLFNVPVPFINVVSDHHMQSNSAFSVMCLKVCYAVHRRLNVVSQFTDLET